MLEVGSKGARTVSGSPASPRTCESRAHAFGRYLCSTTSTTVLCRSYYYDTPISSQSRLILWKFCLQNTHAQQLTNEGPPLHHWHAMLSESRQPGTSLLFAWTSPTLSRSSGKCPLYYHRNPKSQGGCIHPDFVVSYPSGGREERCRCAHRSDIGSIRPPSQCPYRIHCEEWGANRGSAAPARTTIQLLRYIGRRSRTYRCVRRYSPTCSDRAQEPG